MIKFVDMRRLWRMVFDKRHTDVNWKENKGTFFFPIKLEDGD